MSFLEATGVYIQCLFKISSEILIWLIGLVIFMTVIRFIKKDKCYFTKKLRRYFYGANFKHCK